MICCLLTLGSSIFILAVSVVIVLRLWIHHRAKSLLPELRENKKTVTVGFFHPYCHAGGGGERVLWTAIRALQNKYPHVKCVVYTGDIGASSKEIIQKARQTFNIVLPKPVTFVFLEKRNWVEASTYPYFTLLGQSLGSIYLGIEALLKFVPDIYIDSMGYAFTLPFFRYFGGCKVGCYVHYPTISTDMLARVFERRGTYNNASFISQSTVLSHGKMMYYRLFAWLYGFVGRQAQTVMVNSSWTEGHILHLWKTHHCTSVVYPPCDIREFTSIPLKDKSSNSVQTIVSVGQFRPEKDHPLQIQSFQHFLRGLPKDKWCKYRLVLIGGCRDDNDAARVADLREICKELNVQAYVEFKLNISFADLKKCLASATIGLHTMWCEHFGIGVVECMAAGTIILAHKSGGPKSDIVIDYNGKKTGYLADSVSSYAQCMADIMDLPPTEKLEICEAARQSVKRFSEMEFENGFLSSVEKFFGS